jgi:dihydroflavonol-4-reductase
MTVLVTGGSGFVGAAVLRRLVADGERVIATARSPRSAGLVASLGAVAVEVDLFDPDAATRAMEGVETVFHVAGRNTACTRRPDLLERDNVDLAVSVVRAAARAGVPRVVLTSSAATIGERAGEVGREGSVHRGSFLSPYERTKYLGERAALETARATGVDLVVVNPCSVQGPGRATGTARLLFRVAGARRPVLVRTWVSVVDVEDCAEGHLLAARHGTPGRRYLLCGASVPVQEAVEVLRRLTGSPRSAIWVPAVVARALLPAAWVIARLQRSEDPLVCPAAVRGLLHGHRYDGSRATQELGLRYRSLEETAARTLAWGRERGLLRDPGWG